MIYIFLMYILFWNIDSIFFFQNDIYFIIPEFYLLFVIFVLLIVYVAFEFSDSTSGLCLILLRSLNFNFLWSLLLLILLYINTIDINFIALNFYFVSNFSVLFLKITLSLVFVFFLLILYNRKFSDFEFKWEFFILLMFALFGLLIVCSSYDFVLLYLSLELYSLALYVLVSWHILKPFSTEAGLKYFILGSFASGLLLLGLSFIYFGTGSLNFEDIGLLLYMVQNFSSYKWVMVGFIFISFAFFFKLGIAPFHLWNPDVYEGAPYIITMFMAIIPKMILVLLLYRVFLIVFIEFDFIWLNLCAIGSVISFLVGAFGAIYQIKIKRILAYSSINNAGFFVLALTSDSFFGLSGGLLYMFIYSIIMSGIFIFFLSLAPFSNTEGEEPLLFIHYCANLFLTNPLLAYTGGLLLLSLAGIPPLLGFFGKFVIFYAIFENSLYFLGVISMIFTVITSFYYLRLVKIFFFSQKEIMIFLPLCRGTSLLLGFILMINIMFFFCPEYLFICVHNITLSFFVS